VLLSSWTTGDDQGVAVGVTRRNQAHTARATTLWITDAAAFSCAAKLGTCQVDTGTAMGAYGTVDLAFQASQPATTTHQYCPGTDIVRSTQKERKGHLTGTLRLRTHTELFGTIRNGAGAHHVPLSIPATASRTVATGEDCPDPGPKACDLRVSLVAGNESVIAERPLPTGPGALNHGKYGVSPLDPEVFIQQLVLATGPGAQILTVDNTPTQLSGAQLDMSRAAPFLDGTASFDANGPSQVLDNGTCQFRTRPGILSGDFTVHMPGFAAYAGPDTQGASLSKVIP
jgi:hypothetical protein